MDIAEWGDHPTLRVRGKNFVFSAVDASGLSFKLSKDEAAAVVATDDAASPGIRPRSPRLGQPAAG